MKIMRFSALVALLVAAIMMPSCGETFRPITTPILLPSGTPNRINTVVVVSSANITDPTQAQPALAQHINLSGDTVSAVVQLGYNPNFAFDNPLTLRTTVSNTGPNGSGPSTISQYSTPVPSFNGATLISLPPNTAVGKKIYSNSGSFIYVVLFTASADCATSTVRYSIGVIDTNNNFFAKTIQLTDPCAVPSAMVGTPDGLHLYIADSLGNKVYIIDQNDNSVLPSPIVVGTNPQDMAITADGSTIYVMNQGSNDLTIINTTTNSVVNNPPSIGTHPLKLLYDKKLLRLYVLNQGSSTTTAGSLSIIGADPKDTAAGGFFNKNIVPDVAVGIDPVDLATLPNGSFVYILNRGDRNITVLNTLNNTKLLNNIIIGTIDHTDVNTGHSIKGTYFYPISISASDDSSRIAVAIRDPLFTPSLNPANKIAVGDQNIVPPLTRGDGNAIWTIDTSTNQPLVMIPTPQVSSSTCNSTSISINQTCTLMQPMFVLR